jgi:hypothetical protein
MTINVNSEQGNVFYILGAAKTAQKQLKKEGQTNETLDSVLTGYTEMTYDKILDKLQSTGFFKFTGRKK